ncbi:MAG: Cdc6/Cdc18 family protein [Promethearchaeati archaeon]
MSYNYFEKLLGKPSLFKAEYKLDINYIPERLPHREKELSLLSQLFSSLITQPNSISRKLLITGKTGIGKTATVRQFGNIIIEAAFKREINIKYIHINCRKERTSYKVLISIIGQLKKDFPKRGYSPQDLLEIIKKVVHNQNLHIILVLDELNYLINKEEDLIYSLTRMYDDSYNSPQRLSLIGIVRDISFLNNLDNSTLSTLQRNIIKFDTYSKDQIKHILKYRSSLSLKKDVISDEILKSLAEIVFEKGDIRYGLNILWKSCKIAESKDLRFLTPEIIRLANQEIVPYSVNDILKYMNLNKSLFLLSILRTLKNSNKVAVSVSNIINEYYLICENANKKPKSYSQIWNYLNDFNRDGIITVSIKSKNISGRKSLIKIQEMPLKKLEIQILNKLKESEIAL